VSALFHNAGNIGIGTASPGSPLVVSRNANDTLTRIVLDNPNAGSSALIVLGLSNDYGPVTTVAGLKLGSSAYSGLGGGNVLDVFNNISHTILSTVGVERMRIDSNGNVGIGTTTPQAKLDVNGNMINNNLPMYGVRAWVKFSGVNDVNGNASTANTDRQIFASGNVTRVNRWALGNFDIYLTTPFANTNYSVVANIVHAVGYTTAVHIDAVAHTAGVVRAWCSYQPNTLSYDPNVVDVWVIG
jgi:hypothetical protein